MKSDTVQPFRALLADKLADSLAAPFPAATPRRIYGTVSLPGKATAVVGVRRAGKTTLRCGFSTEGLWSRMRSLLPTPQ